MALDVVTSVVVAISVALLSVDVMFKDIVVAVELLNPVVVLATRSGGEKASPLLRILFLAVSFWFTAGGLLNPKLSGMLLFHYYALLSMAVNLLGYQFHYSTTFPLIFRAFGIYEAKPRIIGQNLQQHFPFQE